MSASKSENEKDEREQKSKKKTRSSSMSKNYSENVVKVVKISAIGWMACGFILGSVCGGPWCEDIVNWMRGYRWNYLDRLVSQLKPKC